MPAANKAPRTELYCALSAASGEKCDRNQCSVISVAALLDVSYDDAFAALEAAGRKKGEGVYDEVIEGALASFNVTPRKVEYSERRALIDTYPGVHKGLKSITPHHATRFAKAWDAAGWKNGLIFTRGHVMALKDGVIHDHQLEAMKRVVAVWLVDLPTTEEAVEGDGNIQAEYEEVMAVVEEAQSTQETAEEEAPVPEAPAEISQEEVFAGWLKAATYDDLCALTEEQRAELTPEQRKKLSSRKSYLKNK